jgi:acetyl esterase/lipase
MATRSTEPEHGRGTAANLLAGFPPPQRYTVRAHPDLVYAEHDGVTLQCDGYAPDGDGPFPAMLGFHGGGWTMGGKGLYSSWGMYLASYGIAMFDVSYRLSQPDHPTWRESVWDCQSALRWVRGNAARFNLDPARVGLMGGSAGGHLAALLALGGQHAAFANPYDEPFRDIGTRVQVVVPVYGVFDMHAAWESLHATRPPNSNIVANYLGGTPMDVRERYYLMSPVYHASTQNAAGTRWCIVWGTADSLAPQSEQIVPHLQRAGASVQTNPILGAPHGFLSQTPVDEPGSWNAQLAPPLMRFLRAALGIEVGPSRMGG